MLAAGLNSRRKKKKKKKTARKQSSASFSVGRLEGEREREMNRVRWICCHVCCFYPGKNPTASTSPPTHPVLHTLRLAHLRAHPAARVCTINTQRRQHFACPLPVPSSSSALPWKRNWAFRCLYYVGGMSVTDWKLFPAMVLGVNQSFCTYSLH